MSDCSVPQESRQTAESVVHQSYHDVDGDTSLSTAILLALDSVSTYDVEHGDTVVFDHIDLDALDDLFAPVDGTDRSGSVTFTVEEYEVTATADGEITIRERASSATK